MYTIYFSDPSKSSAPITISTGTNNTSTGINLVGKNYPLYGPLFASNFLHLLENFASPVAPSNPVEGHIWYNTSDASDKKLQVNNGLGNTWDNIGLKTRITFTTTTDVLAAGTTSTVSFAQVGKSYALIKLESSSPARIRVYMDDASRSADILRSSTVDPQPNIGLITEVVTTASALATVLSPAVIGFNNDSPVTTTMYMAVTNNAVSSQAIMVSVTFLKLEQ